MELLVYENIKDNVYIAVEIDRLVKSLGLSRNKNKVHIVKARNLIYDFVVIFRKGTCHHFGNFKAIFSFVVNESYRAGKISSTSAL